MDVSTHRNLPDDWQALAASHGLFYHDPAWIDAIATLFDFPLHVVAVRDAGVLVGGLALAEVPALVGPRRLVSFPFSYAAGPLVVRDDVRQGLVSGAVDLARRLGVKRLEIKSVAASGPAPLGLERVTRYAAYRVSTDGGEQAVWRRLNVGSTQRGIKKSAKLGVVVERGESAADWRAMARLEEATSQRLGTPAPPRRYFEGLARSLQARGLADLYVARAPGGSDPIAAIVLWKGRREWIYAFGASVPAALELRPNHALLWRALRDAIEASVVFDLGRAAPEQTGLVEFKERWAGVAAPLAYDYWPRAAGMNVARRDGGGIGLAARLWSRLPAWVARRGGGHLYRYLG